jgi:hypothetical protein
MRASKSTAVAPELKSIKGADDTPSTLPIDIEPPESVARRVLPVPDTAAMLPVVVRDPEIPTVVVLLPDPMVTVVVEPVRPPVPMLIVLVLPDAVAPAWMLVVCDKVERPIVRTPVPVAPPIVKIPVV